MALKLLTRRLAATYGVSVPIIPSSSQYSSLYLLDRAAYSNKVLGEEEKAAENIYIKKVEREKLEKLAGKGLHAEEKPGTDGEHAAPASNPQPAKDNSKFMTYAAIVVAAVAGGWWFSRSSEQEKGKAEKSKE